jgi:cAMP-dependent protein kinase regulator
VAPTAQDIGRAAAALAAQPADLSQWLELATLLAAAGRTDEAEAAFARLGRAACVGGQVALAVACARWLAEQDAGSAPALIDQIVATHAAGAPGLDAAVRPRAPRSTGKPPKAPRIKDVDGAVASAGAAIERALEHATEAAPDRYPATPLVSSLPPADLRALLDVMTVRARPAGDVVIETGDAASALYWIARGSVQVTRGEHVLGELRSGAFFGEIALVSGTTRTATVTCLEDTWLIEIPADQLEVAARQGRLARTLARYARVRLLANVMRTSALFARMTEDDRSQLLGRFTTALMPAGARVIEAGKDNEHLWVVVSGRCQVTGPDGVVAEVGPGDAVGEMSLIARKPAVADVVAIAPTAMLRLARDEFETVAVKYPELLAEVYKLLLEREHANRAPVEDATDLVV